MGEESAERLERDRFMAAEDPRVRIVELVISALLRIGVVTSLIVVVMGMVLSFARSPRWLWSRDQLAPLVSRNARFPHSVSEVFAGAMRLDGPSLVMVGLLLLIATPVMRVAVSILAFVYQKDRRFVIITTLVLALLVFSFLRGQAGG